MKERFLLTLFLTLLLTATSAKADDSRYAINVNDFNSLTVVDGINVNYYTHADSAGYVVFVAAPEMASNISFSNNKKNLRIQTLADEKPFKGVPTVAVYSSSLQYLENSGDSLVCAHLGTHVDKLTTKVIGNGTIKLSGIDAGTLAADAATGHGHVVLQGKADKAKLRNVGTGSIDASALDADPIDCFILGSGTVDVSTEGTLKIKGAGKGKVITHRKPRKTVNRSIGIKSEPSDSLEQKP